MASATRMKILLDRQSSTAKKVYDAIPIDDWWSAIEIHTEMKRSGVLIDHHILRGCVASLYHDGLVKDKDNKFQRVKIEDKPVAVAKPAQTNVSAPPSPLDELSDIAGELIKLAKRVENLALSIEERSESDVAELTQLRQLKTLLKGMT